MVHARQMEMCRILDGNFLKLKKKKKKKKKSSGALVVREFCEVLEVNRPLYNL